MLNSKSLVQEHAALPACTVILLSTPNILAADRYLQWYH